MALVLQIIGGLVLLFILLVAAAFLFLRWKLRRLAKELGEMAGGGGMVGGPPTQLRLRRANASEWNADDVRSKAEVFDGLGYERISAYETPDMPGLKLMPFASKDQLSYALIYHLPGGMGVWCDIFTKYADGTSLTVTSAARGGELEHRPGNEKAYLPGSSPEQLHEIHKAKLAEKPVRPATIEGFARDFEQTYEEEMAWRATKGYSDEEIRAVAALDGDTYSEEVFSQTKEALHSESAAKLTEILHRKYMKESGLSAPDWEDQRGRIIIVHDRMTPADVADEVCNWVDLEDDDFDKAEKSQLDARTYMDELAATVAGGNGFKKAATLHDPVEADVWLASVEED